jgi:hypothetical protein
MLKILILLECDYCNGVEITSPDASRIDGDTWAAAARDFLYSAEQSGWCIYHKYTCDICVIEAQYEQEQSRS